MDYGSTDGTQEVIGSTEWGDLVRVVEFPGLDDLDSSNILLELMKAELPEDGYSFAWNIGFNGVPPAEVVLV